MQLSKLWSRVALRLSVLQLSILVLGVAVPACGDQIPPITVPGLETTTSGSAGTTGTPGKSSSAGKSGTKGTSGSTVMDAAVASSDEDAGTLLELLEDGQGCSENAQCASAHCNNDLCCSGGACCVKTSDCRANNGVANVCDYAGTCQGSRGKVLCSDFRCVTKDGAPNDTGCDQDVEANDCGPYKSVYCTGAADQVAPRCAEACVSDRDCDADARCTDGACVRKPSGSVVACQLESQCAAGEKCTDGVCAATAGAPGVGSPISAASCMATMATRDACNECACSKCAASAMACTSSGNTMRDGLCKAVLECVLPASCINSMDCEMSMPGAAAAPGGMGMMSRGIGMGAGIGMGGGSSAYGCFGRDCYCGADCYTNPTGPCVKQIAAAAGNSSSATTISTRGRDPAYALSYAETHVECLERSCKSECGL